MVEHWDIPRSLRAPPPARAVAAAPAAPLAGLLAAVPKRDMERATLARKQIVAFAAMAGEKLQQVKPCGC
jgi:hypothetical protein